MAIAAIAGAVSYMRGMASPPVDVDRLVANALNNEKTGDYVARVRTSVIYCGRAITTEAVVLHDGDREKIENPGQDGRGAWAMTDGSRRYTFLPKDRVLLVSEQSGVGKANLLLLNYKPEYAGMDKVAGRRVYVVDLVPRREGRPSKKLWIDREHYTILRSVDYSASGDERGGMETIKIAYNAKVDPGAFRLPPSSDVRRIEACVSSSPASLNGKLGFKVVAPGYIPSGYRLEGYYLYNCQCRCNHSSAQLTYTDGLNVISVFETSAKVACANGSCSMGAQRSGKCAVEGCEMARAGRILRGDKMVVVVGDLPAEEIRRMAESTK